MDASLVAGGFNFLSGAITQSFANGAAKYQAATANNIRAGNNRVIDVANERNAILTATQRWAQTVRNSRVYENLTEVQAAQGSNFNRQRDARTKSNFAANVKFAEEDGRQAAAAAASGVTGSVVDVINTTSRVRKGIEEASRLQDEEYIDEDYKHAEFRTNLIAKDSIDYGIIFDNEQLHDFGNNIAKTGSVISAGLANNGALKQLTQGLSTFKFQQEDGYTRGITGNLSIGDL